MALAMKISSLIFFFKFNLKIKKISDRKISLLKSSLVALLAIARVFISNKGIQRLNFFRLIVTTELTMTRLLVTGCGLLTMATNRH